MSIFKDLVDFKNNFNIEEEIIDRIKKFIMEKTVHPDKRAITTLQLQQPYVIGNRTDFVALKVVVIRGEDQILIPMAVTHTDELQVFDGVFKVF